MRDRILTSSAVSLAAAIRNRELTSVEVVDAHIARIRAVNPAINALVKDRFSDARREAVVADEKTASVHKNDLPPFHGIPFTTKDAQACEGMPNTSGLWSRRDTLASKDGTAVRRLKDAGAILLGVSNISELCMWMESSNKIWGRTKNPYDTARTCGGSSGGEGALVGAGGSVIGLGSDVGGSIRMPAFFNGVFGHKPTGGLVPNTGHYPPAENLHQRYVTTGPIVRRAEDLMPFMRVVAGPDGIEEHCIKNADHDHALDDPKSIDLSRLTAFVVPDNGVFKVSKSMHDAQERAVRVLEAAGARIERRTQIPGLKRSIEIWSSMLHEGGPGTSFQDMLSEGAPPNFRPIREIAKIATGRESNYTVPGLFLCLIERIPALLGDSRTKQMVAHGHELRREIENMLGDNGVLLFPSYPSVAPRHHMALVIPLKWIYTGIFNVLEMPVTQVPMGLDEHNVPVGVQVVASNRRDAMTIAVAIELERCIGGWTPPPLFPIS